jgi:periplasmic protein TonB
LTADESFGPARTVSEILARRARTGQPPVSLTAGLSILAHAAFVAAVLLAGRARHVPVAIPISLPVRVVSPAALGRPEAAPAPVPAPATAQPVPEPAKARPVIEKKRDEKVQPSPNAMPALKPAKAKPTPPPRPVPGKGAAPAVDLPTAAGLPTGTAGATGTALSFGTDVAAFDADFPFTYYVQQLLSLIGANWFRPDAPDGAVCTVTFRIQRSGQVADVKVEAGSGISYYDRAAVRAVFAANPLPPLPNDYLNDQLGVHLRFR